MAEQEPGGGQKGQKWWLWFWAAVGVQLLLVYYYYSYPRKNLGPEQPISFSHRVHAGVKQINCRFCHPYVERSKHAGIPSMEKCFFCHTYVIPGHPEIIREKAHYQGGNPVKWVRVMSLPDFVKFRHSPHVRWGKVDCSACHGRVETKDRLQTPELQMGYCVSCHEKRGATLDCWLACHR